MPGNGPANLPSVLFGQRFGVAVKFAAGDVLVFVEISLPIGERQTDIISQFVLQRVGTDNEWPAKIGLPLLEDGSKVEK